MKKNPVARTLPLFECPVDVDATQEKKSQKTKPGKNDQFLPEKLGKAVRLPVPDFSDPKRKLTCLEVDFPIAQINALSNLEGNAGKPIYQMSKWWARRRSSVFRSLLIAAATEAPDDPTEAAKKVWDHYYCNHQKAGSFKNLRVLDCFMGGGTTLVEGSRLGMQMTGVDLNPVAWFIVKNELACSDPVQVQAFFDYIEAQVKPQIQPFYTTSCPRGHKGRWVDVQAGDVQSDAVQSGDVQAGGVQTGEAVGAGVGVGVGAGTGRCSSSSPNKEEDGHNDHPHPASHLKGEECSGSSLVKLGNICDTGIGVDTGAGIGVDIDPLSLPPEERSRYRWEGPEIIYTFWAKHGPCQNRGCGHRTPIFRTPVVAEKNLSTSYIELTCPGCGQVFHAELGETRMAPGVERVVLEGEAAFTEMSQNFAQLLNDYDKGRAEDTIDRMWLLKERVNIEPGMYCPACGAFAGKRVMDVLRDHAQPSTKVSQRKKKDFGIQRKSVQMYLLIHPEWLKGAAGFDEGVGIGGGFDEEGREECKGEGQGDGKWGRDGKGKADRKGEGKKELGGWAGAPAQDTAKWFERRLENLALIELRGKALAEKVEVRDGTIINTEQGTVPKQAQFTCGHCGKSQDRLAATKAVRHTAPIAVYALQCHCPQCEAEGYNYGGRYFKSPDEGDIERLKAAEAEWEARGDADLNGYWPRQEMPYSHMTHERNPLPEHGYTHWWKMFNSRQLLVHALLLKTITDAPEDFWPLDVREQALGAFQQYLRNQNMFIFWNPQRDTPEPMFSNANYNPKMEVIENCVFNYLGRGNWQSSSAKCVDAMKWSCKPWELIVTELGNTKSEKGYPEDPLVPGNEPYCGSSTNLTLLGDEPFDFAITDPPFGNNLFYADCADFFYVWLRISLQKWYTGLPEQQYFLPDRTPHSIEAIDNPAEHPDDREEYEKSLFITSKYLDQIRALAGEHDLQEKDPNPLYRPEPSSDFYSQTLSACWAESGRLLKEGGIMAFTFHHNEDNAWIDVLKALFDAGFLLIQTYPIRSDESKGENAAFGSKKIEYDIIHVCRKRLEDPEPVSWARMRRWVKSEAQQLKELLEHTHAKELPESDLRVILRGKSLEFYSSHYGQVYTGDGQVLDVRDALLGINQLLDDLLEGSAASGGILPPDIAEPASRLYLRIFRNRQEMPRDELHKTLRGTGISQGDLEARGWIRDVGKVIHLVPIHERFAYFTERGRNRKVIKADLDQAHFLIAAAFLGSGIKIENELDNPNFKIKKAVDEILKWYAAVSDSPSIRTAADTAWQLVDNWRNRKDRPRAVQMSLYDKLEEDE